MNDTIHPNEADTVRPEWRWFVGLGIVLLVLGLVTLSHSVMATVVTLEVCGWLLLIAGAAQFTHAVWSPDWRGFFTHALYGMLGAVVGFLVIVKPLVGAEAVALLMAAYFIVGGLLFILATAAASRQNSVWIGVMADAEVTSYSLEVARIRQHRYGLLLSGIIHLLLGILILSFWPPDSLWLVGVFVGLSLLLSGGCWLILGLGVRSFIRQLDRPAATPEVTPPALRETVAARAPETDGLAEVRHPAQPS
jgi:uncharacterized membrane protein HdeD (DUF308 family)